MALALCRNGFSTECQEYDFFSTNCHPACYFSTNCQPDHFLQYGSGCWTTCFKKYKNTLCRDVFSAHFFYNVSLHDFALIFKTGALFVRVVVSVKFPQT